MMITTTGCQCLGIMKLRNCFEFGNKPEVWALGISLVKSPRTLSELLPLSD